MAPAQVRVLTLTSVASLMVALDVLVVSTALSTIRRTCTPRWPTWNEPSTPTSSAWPCC